MNTYIITIDTKGTDLNALEGVLHMPSGTHVVKIETGHSALVLWVSAPTANTSAGTVTFSGITPGGFEGVRQVFSMTTAEPLATASVRFDGVNALANDGKATAVQVVLSIAGSQSVEDHTQPEAFAPAIATSTDVFGGRPFAIFSAVDKQSGIDHYEVSSGYFRPGAVWVRAESPYFLSNNELEEKIFIKAVDVSGNARVESVAGPEYSKHVRMWAILIVLAACVLSYLIKARNSRS